MVDIAEQWPVRSTGMYSWLSTYVHHVPPHQYRLHTVYPKKYAHGFCFAVLCCGYTLTDFPIPIRLTSLARWQSNDCPSASKATLMNMDKYFMWIHYERLHNHNKAKHNKTVCIFLGIYCKSMYPVRQTITYYTANTSEIYKHGFAVLCFFRVISSVFVHPHIDLYFWGPFHRHNLVIKYFKCYTAIVTRALVKLQNRKIYVILNANEVQARVTWNL